jgi:hypothetical protein
MPGGAFHDSQSFNRKEQTLATRLAKRDWGKCTRAGRGFCVFCRLGADGTSSSRVEDRIDFKERRRVLKLRPQLLDIEYARQ